ncbi:UDP-3-O-acyl-N-acetylglucosamine deacetylase [Rhodobacterales bacterium HKCCE2091]|nr:UDP-3-O-acyl-N-acetylglucosamine deacetylase [Rhodobacterales bacterium HKCCE2091]
MQATIRSAAAFTGVGLHSGRPVRMTIRPAAAHFGIWFRRVDIAGFGRDALVPARYDAVPDARLCTRLRNADGVEVSTVEHVMAALAGTGIHNALIEIDAPEVPILDGSAAPFVRAILARGVMQQDAAIHAIEVLKPVRVEDGEAWAELRPGDGLTMRFSIEFDDAAIGRQTREANLANGRFVRELCDSRTFCRASDIDAMRANGLALGGTYENAVVVDGSAVLSPGGLRHADEAVRHKMLDALGDLALAGAPLIAHYEGNRAGHALTNRLLRALFATPGAVRFVECSEAQAARLPGAGLCARDLADVA